ncbi:MAG: hypothetical protein MR432_05985 [Prevotellaceae bacterium]|nr:hypothetical protein [Prevotellaceae bacterium]
MDEYIEREAAQTSCRKYSFAESYDAFAVDCILKAIQAADVAPVRHGRWECNKPCPVCGRDRFEGLDADIWADWKPPYCPNCGCRMDGGADKE